MRQQTYPLRDAGIIQVKAFSNLRITGWERSEVVLDAGYGINVEPTAEGLRIKSLESCEIFAPATARLVVERVAGELHVANMSGIMMIEKVDSATLFHIGAAQVGKVGDDLRVKNVSGDFTVEKVGGNFDGSDFSGGLALGNVGGDINALNVRAGFSGRAGGNIRLMLLADVIPPINARAGGDLVLLIAQNARARFEVISGAEDLRVEVGSRVQRINTGNYDLVIGAENSEKGTLRAGGSVSISDRQENWQPGTIDRFSALEERITARIRAKLQAADLSAEITNRMNSKVQDAMRRAEERITAAMQRLETHGFGASGGAASKPPVPPIPPVPPVPPVVRHDAFAPEEASAGVESVAQESVTDEERLLILRMLQEKKITVEQAEDLMEALEANAEE